MLSMSQLQGFNAGGGEHDPYWDQTCLSIDFNDSVVDATGTHTLSGSGYSFENNPPGKRIVFPDESTLNSDTSACLKLAGEFTIEMFLEVMDLSSQIFGRITSNTSTYTADTCYFHLSPGGIPGQLAFAWFGTGTGNEIGVLSTGSIYHVAVTRDADNRIDGWLNGVKSGAYQTDSQNRSVNQLIEVATTAYYSLIPANIKMKSLRITNACRYSGTSFTPPTAPFPSS